MEDNRAYEQAKNQIESILKLSTALTVAEESKDESEREKAIESIQCDPLEVSMRSGWYHIGDTPEAEEFSILLCTGGPAVRIIGELDQYKQPINPQVQFQDWGTPWTDYRDTDTEEDGALLVYCNQFYFGE